MSRSWTERLGRIGLTGWIFIAILAAVAMGWIVGAPLLVVTEPLGTAFLSLLKMIIVPLIASTVFCGVAGLSDPGGLGRLGLKTAAWVAITCLLAILTGLFLVNLIQPGVGAELGLHKLPEGFNPEKVKAIDILLKIIPDNLVAATARGEILPVILFAVLAGIFTNHLAPQHSEPLKAFMGGVSELMMKITGFIIHLAPFGAFGLVATIVARTGFAPFVPLAKYALCVLLGILLHGLVTLPLILRLMGGISPVKMLKAVAPALLTAFSTSSSSATLPLSLECAEKRAGISNRVCSFVLPVGTTVNMNGTALYECVAVLFISQYYSSHGMTAPLSVTQQILVVFTALLAAVGAAGIPMAGIVMMSMVLSAVGLPLEGIGLILAVDRILDMARTTLNVWGDLSSTALIAASEGETGLTVLAGRE
ncbi:dicarboxylate/amino acid:cation symporter [bacterium]|nr:dicarboxylate/amino acid:cation symporter [bacterium]